MNRARSIKIIRWSSKTLLILLSVCSFVTCKKKSNPPKEEVVVKAYRLIDEQRTSEAIDLLEEELKIGSTANIREIKFVLASAYAHKAGIKIQVLVPAVTQLYKLQNASKKKKSIQNQATTATNAYVNPNENLSRKPVNKIAVTLSAIFNQISATLETYAAIPTVNETQIDFLKHSIELIYSIGEPLTQEQALYRAVLEIILFKHIIEEGLLTASANIDFEIIEDKNCVINVKKLNDSIVPLAHLLIDIFNDMVLANPKHAESLTKSSAEITNYLTELTLASGTINVMDDVTSSFLKRSAFELGLGKMIKCNEN